MRAALWGVAALYVLWSVGFILRSSVRLADGSRTFCLFDDSMISLRYAENLVRGHGLVWNPGERVEGYSNPLMVLVMAPFLAALPKPLAVLAIQVLGGVVVLACGLLAVRLHERVASPAHRAPPWLVLAAVLSTYTLSYWAVMGMETGLVALLTMLGALEATRPQPRPMRLGWTTALLYLCRPDALLIGAVLAVLGLTHGRRPDARAMLNWALPVAAVISVHTAFRLAYYGSLTPNTATLKLTGVPLMIRLQDGVTFIGPFLEGLIPLLGLSIYALAHTYSRHRLLLLAPMAALIVYQVAVGGEPWAYWRIMSPAMPLLIVVAADGACLAAARLIPAPTHGRMALLAGAALIWAMAIHNRPLLSEALLLSRFQEAVLNTERVRAGYALREITGPKATVAVVGAGAIPFYAERRGVDMLGKCDPVIARMAPDVSGSVSWYGMITVPGHNKYDLRRSIIEQMPTYVETPRWGRDNLTDWVRQRYADIEYGGVHLWLRIGSPDVRWELLPPQKDGSGAPAPRVQSEIADLDGDGTPERITLDLGRTPCLIVERDGHSPVTAVPARWRPWKLTVADADGDGTLEVAVGVFKGTRYMPRPHNCLFLYRFDGHAMVPFWLGSSLSRPFTDFAFAPPGSSEAWPLYAVEGNPDGSQGLAEYRWNGFGFVLERRSGAWKRARILSVTADDVILEADGRRLAWNRRAR
jgi:hypothetical protein